MVILYSSIRNTKCIVSTLKIGMDVRQTWNKLRENVVKRCIAKSRANRLVR